MSNIIGLCIIVNVERERAAEEVTKEGGNKRFGCGDFGFSALGALEYCLE